MTKRVFVTVGSTRFNDLIKEVTKQEVLETLYEKGYRYLTAQIGEGSYVPPEGEFFGIYIDSFRYKAALKGDYKKADLIISHAGAGSCMEALNTKKMLITVINESLMGNHQLELATALAEEEYSKWCFINTLLSTIKDLHNWRLKEYVPNDVRKVADYADAMFILSNN